MNPIPLSQIVRILDAGPALPADDGMFIAAVCTDSRRIEAQSLYVALRGERFDGHAFLENAAAAGAVAALVDHPAPTPPPSLRLIQVHDAKSGMGQLARYVRLQMVGKVIAVAGSNGKTGTKRLIAAALGKQLRGSISPKSFNNDVGVPISIFPADPSQDYLVLEIGTNHTNEILPLARIALPDIAVITNCSAEHLEGLGDLAGVRRENASLIEGIRPGGILIVNGDDPELLQAVSHFAGRRFTFGLSSTNDLYATDVRCTASGTSFRIGPHGTKAVVPLLGRHNAANALAAVAVARIMGLDDAEIVENLQSATGPDMRLQLQEAAGVRILNDAYNANPASMNAAIQTLASLPAGRRIAVLGDMRELGAVSAECHRQVGRCLGQEYRPDVLVCVGPEALAIAQEAQRSGMDAGRVKHFPDAAAAAAMVPDWLFHGDLVLLKASRTIGLEAVAEAIFATRRRIAS